jgi:hypothetical protein
MKRRYIVRTATFILFFLSINFYSQNFRFTYQYKVDSAIRPFAKRTDLSIDSVINYVNKNFPSAKEKVRAYYTYISLTIAYDAAKLNALEKSVAQGVQTKSPLDLSQEPEEVFRNKKAVCEGISKLMCKFCGGSSIPAEMVCGYAKAEGHGVPKLLHAWNAVKVDSAWKLLDITWSNGYVDENGLFVRSLSDKYYFISPDRMIRDHLPLDPMWQLSDKPIRRNYFVKRDTTNGKYYTENFSFNDSIQKILSLDQAAKFLQEFKNSFNYDKENPDLIKRMDAEVNNAAARYIEIALPFFDEATNLYNNKIRFAPTKKDCNKALDLMAKSMKELKKAKAIIENYQPVSEEYKSLVMTTKESLSTNLKTYARNVDLINQQKKKAFK